MKMGSGAFQKNKLLFRNVNNLYQIPENLQNNESDDEYFVEPIIFNDYVIDNYENNTLKKIIIYIYDCSIIVLKNIWNIFTPG